VIHLTFEEKAKEVADKILSHESILIVSHIDADGITSASIAKKALGRAGKTTKVKFFKQLDEHNIKSVKEENPEFVWFTDMGSGQLASIKDMECAITDHHEPINKNNFFSGGSQAKLTSYSMTATELNPHRHDINGATEISGAGVTYLVAKKMNENNKDLSKLAVIGAVGDIQTTEDGRLIGKNEEILKDANEEGVIRTKKDTTLYGIQTRPLKEFLMYASNPSLPGLTDNEDNCINLLVEHQITLKKDGDWRKWYHLTKEEKRRILSGIAEKMLDAGYPPKSVKQLIGEIYILPEEEKGTMLRQAKEFSTLLNSCGKYERAKIGMGICLGNRGDLLEQARSLLLGHRKTLVDSMDLVRSVGITEREYLQHFNANEKIPETVIGTVAGMMLSSKDVNGKLPIFGFTKSEEREGIKVSSRGSKQLVNNGLDLSAVMSECSAKVGGKGGGHDIAAGAHIPEEKEGEFLKEAEKMIEEQLEGEKA